MSRPRRWMRAPNTRCSSGSRSWSPGAPRVLISHRFSTVRMADRIVVLEGGPEGGHVVEEGTHEDLVASGGLYSELFAMQAVGYR